MKNPFVISGYAGQETFCDRVEETKRIIHLIDNGHNIVLTAPRRVGKTDLIKHVFTQPEIKDQYLTISVDIYPTRTLSEFVATLGRAILEALRPKGKKMIDKFVTVLASLRSQLTFDQNGFPVWSIGIGSVQNPETTIDEIFRYIEKADRPCLIAIDEFQQITKYPDGARVEAMLRTYIQHCVNARFIYSGSQQHMMYEMFNTSARPFYMSTTLMSLPLIPKQVYRDFCAKLFEERGKSLRPDLADAVYDRFNGVTAYMQRIMNEIFASTADGGQAIANDLDTAVNIILDQTADSYEALYYQLSERQRVTILAIAQEGTVTNPTSAAFVNSHRLLSASSVSTSIKTLVDKEFLTRSKDGVAISDKFFRLWLLRTFAPIQYP